MSASDDAVSHQRLAPRRQRLFNPRSIDRERLLGARMNGGIDRAARQRQEIDLRIPREHQADIEKAVDPGRLIGVTPVERKLASPSRATARMMLFGFEYPDLPSAPNAAGTLPKGCASMNASVLKSCEPVSPTRPVRASADSDVAFLLRQRTGIVVPQPVPSSLPEAPGPRRPRRRTAPQWSPSRPAGSAGKRIFASQPWWIPTKGSSRVRAAEAYSELASRIPPNGSQRVPVQR